MSDVPADATASLVQITVNLPHAIRAVSSSLSHAGLGDESLVLKTVLSQTYAGALKPWRLHAQHNGLATVLAYSQDNLAERAQLALPALQQAVETIQVPMPRLSKNQQLRFRLRFVPTVRQRDENGRSRERDAFLVATEKSESPQRAEVYCDYLAERLAGASIESMSVEGFALKPMVRPVHGGKSKWHTTRLPLVELSGTLTIEDADAFRKVLLRGIGRHRAYGAGFLHLEAL